MKRIKWMACVAALISCFFSVNMICNASGLAVEGTVTTESEYTTIRVNAEDDGNGQLLYAIDSDAPEAFGTSNEFTVKKGSEHTIYVKDDVGNISAQVYKVPDAEMDIELNLGYSNTSSVAEVTDEQREAIEKGGGTVSEQVGTGNVDADRLFYTVVTKDEHVFYLVVDQSRSENNVYLLDQVTDEDLYSLAADVKEKGSNTSIFSTNASTSSEELKEPTVANDSNKESKSSSGDILLWLILIACAAAALYYYKIYKPKKENLNDLSDAKDLDEFEFEDESAEEVLDFTVSEEEKEEMLKKIMNNDDLDSFESGYTEEEFNYEPSDYEMNSAEEEEIETIDELELPEEEDE